MSVQSDSASSEKGVEESAVQLTVAEWLNGGAHVQDLGNDGKYL